MLCYLGNTLTELSEYRCVQLVDIRESTSGFLCAHVADIVFYLRSSVLPIPSPSREFV